MGGEGGERREGEWEERVEKGKVRLWRQHGSRLTLKGFLSSSLRWRCVLSLRSSSTARHSGWRMWSFK